MDVKRFNGIGLKTLDVNSEIKALDGDGNAGVFEGYALTYDVDSVGDRINPGAAQFYPKAKILWQHNWDEPIGVIESVEPDDRGVKIRARLLVDTVQRAREAYAMLKAGLLDSLSIGFVPEKFKFDDDGTRIIEKLTVYETSIVTFPANENATLTSVKAVPSMQNWPLAERERSWDSAAAIRRIREATNSTDSPSMDYRKCFFWFDADAPDNFTSYKLPYCDVIDGRIYAIPRAIFAAAAVLEGARGGIDIPSDDKERIKRIISRWYRKMAEVFDDPSLIAPWDRKQGSFPTFEEASVVYGNDFKSLFELETLINKLRGAK